jgi:4-hydroxybenzoate polyprenyltransferase
MDKPIGSLLLLWPTLNALWIASSGHPSPMVLLIFVLGTLLMRSAGCAINDYADRDFDKHVKRTENRPITSGKIAAWEAVAGSYPFTKRFFAIPQAYLGIAFGFGIPMAFAAVQDHVAPLAWIMLAANVFWSIAYDTEYAMVDRDDDIKIGIRTSALTFGRFDVLAIMLCYAVTLGIYMWIGAALAFGALYWIGWAAAAACAVYHYTLIKDRERMPCFAAFKHNNWLGGVLFAGIAAHYAFLR